MNELISIIIPVWNVDCFLEKCIESILNQTYSNIQVILVDDGSPDLSGAICDAYAAKDSRVEVIHQENGGVCRARNAALKRVRGEYIGFVDPDDWAAEDMFEYLLMGAHKYNAEIVCCHYYRVTYGKETYSQCDGVDYVYTNGQAIEELVNRFLIRNVFWNKLFKREVFESILFPEDRIYEGTAMIYKLMLKADRVVMLGNPKYYYVDNPNSYINQTTLKNRVDYVIAHMDRFLVLEGMYPELKQKLMRDIVDGILKMKYIRGPLETELKDNAHDILRIQKFIQKHQDYIEKNNYLEKAEWRQLHDTLKLTLGGIKNARYLAALNNRLKALKRIVGRTKNVQKAIEKERYEAPIYREEQKKLLRKIQLYELDILKELDRICKKHNIQYFLYGGTLLGAVRHKGFIPWDDDVDIVMPRKDYDAFAKICETELGNNYFYQTCFTDKDFPLLFAKIRRNDSAVFEQKWLENEMHNGIFIDILPLDDFPDSMRIGKALLHMVSFFHRLCTGNIPKSGNIIKKSCFAVFKRLSIKRKYKLREFALHMSNHLGGKTKVCSYGSHYQPTIKRVLCKDWFVGDERMKFEDGEFCVPKGWQEYLIHLYGYSYMELPPEKDRQTHLELSITKLPREEQKNGAL